MGRGWSYQVLQGKDLRSCVRVATVRQWKMATPRIHFEVRSDKGSWQTALWEKEELNLTSGCLTKTTKRTELPIAKIRKTARKAGLGRTLEPRFGHNEFVCLFGNQVEILSKQLDILVWTSVDRSGLELSLLDGNIRIKWVFKARSWMRWTRECIQIEIKDT